MKHILAILCLIFVCAGSARAEAHGANLPWLAWSDENFARAQKENKLLLLDLEAVWCHWCHVMEEKTYSDPVVNKLLSEKFILMKVDQDARPDLGNKYKDYGWPATIIFNAKGEELRKLAGFVPPEEMTSILKAVIADPTPKEVERAAEEVSLTEANLSDDVRTKLHEKQYSSFDAEKGGLRTSHRYIDTDSMEYALMRAGESSAPNKQRDADMARKTLDANLALFDPAWGGVYQYSTHFDWQHPHFEKIIPTQATNLRSYALAYSLWKKDGDLKAAQDVVRFLENFLRGPEGAFYVSQDADLKKGEHSEEYFALDDAGRRALGIPAIDKNLYSRENGLVIHALTYFYAASGDEAVLQDARRAAEWILANRRRDDGGFNHGAKDNAGPYLGDSLYMGRALLGLYVVTGDRAWLAASEKAAAFIDRSFKDYDKKANRPGYFTTATTSVGVVKPDRRLDENIDFTRYANLLSHYTGNKTYRQMAEHSMKYIGAPAVALDALIESGVLLADRELSVAPLHITVVGYKDDAVAKSLFKAGLNQFSTYKRIEWWDKREGNMPNPDVEYPQLPKAAAFVCTNSRCSLPIFKPEGIAQMIANFAKKMA